MQSPVEHQIEKATDGFRHSHPSNWLVAYPKYYSSLVMCGKWKRLKRIFVGPSCSHSWVGSRSLIIHCSIFRSVHFDNLTVV